MDKEKILKAIRSKRLTIKQKEEAGEVYAYAYTDAINDCIEAINQEFNQQKTPELTRASSLKTN